VIYEESQLGTIRVIDTTLGNIRSSRTYNTLSYWQNEATRNLLIGTGGAAGYFFGERILMGNIYCFNLLLFKFTPTSTTETTPVWAKQLDSCFPQALLFTSTENYFLALFGYQKITLSLVNSATAAISWSFQLNNNAFNDIFLTSQYFKANNL